MVNNQMNANAGTAPAASAETTVPGTRGGPDVNGAYRIALAYAGLTALSIVLLIIFSAAAPSLATSDAWGHAIIVAIFAFVLPLRLRAVRKNPSPGGVRAGIIIASVLLAVNLVEAFLPMFPGWMRGEMAVIVILTIALIARLTGRLDRLRGRTARARGSR
jgi:hypothetical protein